jgi:F-type H+-transporting ATPase subunit alpha
MNEIQDGELVEFANDMKAMALNLENENVKIVVFGSDTLIVDVPAGKAARCNMIIIFDQPKKSTISYKNNQRKHMITITHLLVTI